VRRAAWVAAIVLAVAAPALAQGSYFDQRLRLFRDLRALNAELLSHDSATAVLQAICDRRAPGQKIMARKSSWAPEEGALEAARADLSVEPDEPVRYRQVELTCGEEVLSSAENWYVPARLTPEIDAVLTGGDTPFGTAIAALRPTRRTLDSRRLHRGGDILRHRALVLDQAGRPLALVIETYRKTALGGD
jgi:chorismate-pyruvate lyase